MKSTTLALKSETQGWGHRSEVKYLSSMLKTLFSIPSITERKKKKKKRKLQRTFKRQYY